LKNTVLPQPDFSSHIPKPVLDHYRCNPFLRRDPANVAYARLLATLGFPRPVENGSVLLPYNLILYSRGDGKKLPRFEEHVKNVCKAQFNTKPHEDNLKAILANLPEVSRTLLEMKPALLSSARLYLENEFDGYMKLVIAQCRAQLNGADPMSGLKLVRHASNMAKLAVSGELRQQNSFFDAFRESAYCPLYTEMIMWSWNQVVKRPSERSSIDNFLQVEFEYKNFFAEAVPGKRREATMGMSACTRARGLAYGKFRDESAKLGEGLGFPLNQSVDSCMRDYPSIDHPGRLPSKLAAALEKWRCKHAMPSPSVTSGMGLQDYNPRSQLQQHQANNDRLGSATAVREHGSACPTIHGPSYEPASSSSRDSSAELHHRFHPNNFGAQHVTRSPPVILAQSQQNVSPLDCSPTVATHRHTYMSPETQAMTAVMNSQQPSPETLQAIFKEKEEQTQMAACFDDDDDQFDYDSIDEDFMTTMDNAATQNAATQNNNESKEDTEHVVAHAAQKGDNNEQVLPASLATLQQQQGVIDEDSSDDESLEIAVQLAALAVKRKREAKEAGKKKKGKKMNDTSLNKASGKLNGMLRAFNINKSSAYPHHIVLL
jgi:hypothetical protein